MFSKVLLLFKIPELRQKVLITLMFLAIYRVGFQIPLSILDQSDLQRWKNEQAQGGALGQLMSVVSMFSASSFGMSTVFGLGIMPYISASIIFQLLASVYPPLEKLQKEGESGRKKINEYTRYATVVLCFGQSFMWVRYLMFTVLLVPEPYRGLFYQLQAAMTMTCGTIFLMWIGEQIDEYGIGNGISLLIMSGIVARMPEALYKVLSNATFRIGGGGGGQYSLETLVVLVAVFVSVVLGVVAITLGQRRIPTQSAKHVRGRRVFGGGRQYLPLRVNQAGVMPIIFASSLLMIPNAVFTWLATAFPESPFWSGLRSSFGLERGYLYNILYVALIYFFCYFWTAITFKPKDMAENLKDYGSFIPGYRPGKRTADYLERVMVRITYVGAAFLAVVAVVPTVINHTMAIDYMVASFYGGTGLLIVVSVALDLVQKIDSHLVMRNYSGLMERG